MTRLCSALCAALMLLADPAAAQQAEFVAGFRQLDAAMLAADSARGNAAVDRMEAALAAWGAGRAPVREAAAADASLLGSLLEDEAAAVPVLPLSAYAEGYSRMRRGEYRDAIPSFRRAVAHASSEWSQLSAAGRLAQQGRDADAERALRAIVAAHQESGVAHWWLARVCEKLNRVADARRAYEMAAGMALSGRAPLYAAIGRLSRIEGDFVRATDAFERRLRLTPADPRAHKDLGRIHLEQGRTDQALAAFTAAVALDAADAEAHAQIGGIRLDTGHAADAITALRRALDLAPAMYEARYPLAQALRQMGRADEAARELALFARAQNAATEDRRRTMAAGVQREEAARQANPR